MARLYDQYQKMKLRITEIQTILENKTESFHEIGEDGLLKELNDLEKHVAEIEFLTGWKW